MSWSAGPNITDFTTYCQNQGIVYSGTPADSEYFQWAFDWSMAEALTCPQMPAVIYTKAVYDFGADRFVRLAQDVPGQTFYQSQRATFGVMTFKPGVVMASGDEGTSQTLVVPEWYRALPMSAQQLLATPWGRDYLAYAQMYGPYVVGVS
ncbi:hypothetical protein [Acidiphilium sp.]|uniref:hypothetical protein n=1 Tax=Acidiphilium sp. TaxID=527 RepID=UPI003D020046